MFLCNRRAGSLITVKLLLMQLDVVFVRYQLLHLAQFCSLKKFELTRNSIRSNVGSCDCQTFNVWVKLRKIKMKSDNLYNYTDSSTTLHEDCTNVKFSNRTYELFNECSAMIQCKMKTEKARSVWIYVASCISVFLFMVFVALFCVHKGNRRQRKNRLSTLPKSRPQMPYLRTLDLDDNPLINSALKMKVTSPLRLLQLAENELTVIPNIGVQPTLLDLNVSNNIISISTDDLELFCLLKELDLTGNNISFKAVSCNCQTFNA